MSSLKLVTKKSTKSDFADAWYVVCPSKDLRKDPVPVTLCDHKIVLFRSKQGVAALLDRCPHRNVPLSLGKVREGQLACSYHGWHFNGNGECTHIPCLDGPAQAKSRNATSFKAVEQDGYIWVHSNPEADAADDPFQFPFMNDPTYVKVHQSMRMNGSVFSVAENALDVPHTAYLHGGVFRKASRRHPIDVKIRRTSTMAEAEYIGEPAPRGVLGRLLAPGGGTVTHYDRFLLPSITQVEYALGAQTHLMITAALTPISRRETMVFGMGALKTPYRRAQKLVAKVLEPLALFVLNQDAKMLAIQSQAIEDNGEESVLSTDADVLGPHILRLLKNAQTGGDSASEDLFEKRIRMFV